MKENMRQNRKTAEKEDETDPLIPLKGKRVLIADDIPINRTLAREILQNFGMETDEAENGREAADRIIKNPAGTYDVLLTDIRMPEMNGFETARLIRSLTDPKKACIPVIAVSTEASEDDRKKAWDAGISGFLAKPLDPEKLQAELIRHIN